MSDGLGPEPASERGGRAVEVDAAPRPGPGLNSRARQRIHAFWRRWRWRVVIATALAAFVLGLIGYGHVYENAGSLLARPANSHVQGLAWPDRIYYTILLFKFSTAADPPYSSWLEVARWLAPLITVYAGFSVIFAIFSDRWARFRSGRLLRGHVVICGLGRCGLRLATADWGLPVVAIDRAPSETEVEKCREHGIALLVGEATDWLLLGQAGLRRARYMVVVCGDDGTNAEVALLAQDLVGRRLAPLACFVHVNDESVCELLEKASLADPGRRPVKFEFFNVNRSGPRALLDSHGTFLSEPATESPQLIVVGSHRLGLNLVVEAARRWSLRPDASRRLRVILVAPDATEQCEDLARRYPDIGKVTDLVACSSNPADPDCSDLGLDEAASHRGFSVVFVCLDDDASGLMATIRVRGELPQQFEIVFCTRGHSDTARLLGLAGSEEPLNVSGFALLDQVCRPKVLLNGDRELIAQAIHNEFLKNERLKGRDENDPAMQPWELLPEPLKESNRDQAADIGRKLKAANLEMVTTSSWGPARFEFSPEDLNRLSVDEHDRWTRKLTADGWKPGPVRDVSRKLHPMLVPWEQLEEADREQDRNAVRAIPTLLARAGYAIVPQRRTVP